MKNILQLFEPKPKVQNYFHQSANNVGDRMCGPAQYFWPDEHISLDFEHKINGAGSVIFGGGQVFGQICSKITETEGTFQPYRRLFAWGVGIPLKGKNDNKVTKMAKSLSLFGTRNFDWKDELDFVPCPSCMSTLFDNPAGPKHEIVAFLHRKKLPETFVPFGIPHLTNAVDNAKEAIDFISSGETVVTNSYHGVYWAQLLGKKVICIPYNDKFKTFEHTPTFAGPETWMEQVNNATSFPSTLEKYRDTNRDFSKKIRALL